MVQYVSRRVVKTRALFLLSLVLKHNPFIKEIKAVLFRTAFFIPGKKAEKHFIFPKNTGL